MKSIDRTNKSMCHFHRKNVVDVGKLQFSITCETRDEVSKGHFMTHFDLMTTESIEKTSNHSREQRMCVSRLSYAIVLSNNKLSSVEKSQILAKFLLLTHCERKFANELLQNVEWNFDRALEVFYDPMFINQKETSRRLVINRPSPVLCVSYHPRSGF